MNMPETGLRVIDFPSVLQVESKLFGLFSPVELLAIFLISSVAWILLKGLGTISIVASVVVFAFAVFMKALMPDEVGYLFPLYEARFAVKKRTIYAHELDTTKGIPSLKFISNWIVKTSGYVAVIEVLPVNFFYSTPADQRAFLDAYRAMLDSLDFPIQILSVTSEFDMGGYLNRFMLRLKDEDIASNPTLSELAQAYINWLDDQVRSVFMRRYFVIVSVQDKKSEDVSISELKRRVEVVASGLRRGGMITRVLERDDILSLYELIENRTILPKNYNSVKFAIYGGGEGVGSITTRR